MQYFSCIGYSTFDAKSRDFAVCSALRVMASPQACNFDLRDSADAIHVRNDPQSVCTGLGVGSPRLIVTLLVGRW